MRATFKLLNSYFWKTIYGPVLSFLIPFALLAILGHIFKVQYIYPGIIALSFLFIGLLSLPLAIMELKRSALFKYIGTSPVNPMRFTIVTILYFIFIAAAASIIIFISTMFLFPKDVFKNGWSIREGILGGIYSSIAGFFSFYISSSVHLIFVIISGLIISTFSKTPQQALTIGICVIIPSMFLSGMIISVDIIAESPALNWISRIIPYRYSTGNMVIASTPLDQLGDMLSRMDIDQKSIIFKESNVVGFNDDANREIGKRIKDSLTGGDIILKSGDIKIYTSKGLTQKELYIARNMKDLVSIKNIIGIGSFEDNINDKALYDLVLKNVMYSNAMNSDNNIFKWTQEWSVQRIPSVSSVQDFIKEYFSSFKGKNGDWTRLKPIANQIAQNKFGWLDIFLKQTNTLYYKPDRVLNLLLPLSLSFYGVLYVVKYFEWSVR